mmetsp:Transcript_28052/g.94477  ORF Transcript_28052/g.94477 Transcript_28052/m.94477 type:complete len:225 (+) Transcript_28052:629-1303(+)
MCLGVGLPRRVAEVRVQVAHAALLEQCVEPPQRRVAFETQLQTRRRRRQRLAFTSVEAVVFETRLHHFDAQPVHREAGLPRAVAAVDDARRLCSHKFAAERKMRFLLLRRQRRGPGAEAVVAGPFLVVRCVIVVEEEEAEVLGRVERRFGRLRTDGARAEAAGAAPGSHGVPGERKVRRRAPATLAPALCGELARVELSRAPERGRTLLGPRKRALPQLVVQFR